MLIDMSDLNVPYYAEILKREFESRKKKNPRYSLRAYARFLSINSGSLSLIIDGRRKLPKDLCLEIAKKLLLADQELEFFVESVSPSIKKFTDSHTLDVENTRILFENWEHMTILALFRLDEYESSPEWIADMFNSTPERVSICLNELLEMGLIRKTDTQKFERTYRNIGSTHDIPSDVIRKSHQVNLELAKEKLESVPVEKRNFLSINVALDERHIRKLNKMLLKFRQEVFDLDEASQKNQVYKVSFISYPLSRSTRTKV